MSDTSWQSIDALLAGSKRDRHGRTFVPDARWMQGRSLYGGVQFALAMHTIRDEIPDLGVRSAQSAFIAPVAADREVRAQATLLRQGRTITHARCELRQEGTVCFETTVILGGERPSSTIEHRVDFAPEDDPEALPGMPYIEGTTPEFVQHYDMRWAVGQPPYTGARDPRAVIYVRRRPPRAWPESELLALADAIPSPAISLASKPAPASSVSWSQEWLHLPQELAASDWVRFEVELHEAHGGYAWHTANMIDPSGRLIAISRQCVAVFA